MSPDRIRKASSFNTGGYLLAVGDLIALSIAFLLAMPFTEMLGPIVPNTNNFSYIHSHEHGYLYCIVSAFTLFGFLIHGHYTQRIPWWNQVRIILIFSVFAMMCEGFASFLLELPLSSLLVIVNWCACFLLLILFRLLFFRLRANSKSWEIPTVIMGDPTTVSDILFAFNADPGTGYDIRTVFLRDQESGSFSFADLPKRYSKLNVVNHLENYQDYIIKNPELYYVIVLDTFRGSLRDKIIDTLNKVNAVYSIVPSVSRTRMSIYEMEPKYFFGYDIVLLQPRPALSNALSRFGKRFIDITSSGFGLLVFSPIFFFIIAALKIEGHQGSIFYGGERLGQDGKMFNCWKFQTMAPNSDHILHEYLEKNPEAKEHWEKYLKLPDDPRVTTRTAYLLRKSSLDEIPQLWNVFKGNMSLVGPRPILPKEVDLYGEMVKDYIKVKPGITGLWQVSGRNSMSFQRRIYWDSWYVRNWSIWGDIVIILKTIPAVLLRDDGH